MRTTGVEKFKPLCNSIECPDNFTPIPDAATTECDGGVCGVSQCCEAFCSYFACPGGYIPVEDADIIPCPDSGCTKSLCCGTFSKPQPLNIYQGYTFMS